MKNLFFALAVTAGLSIGPAHAVTMTWTLSDVTTVGTSQFHVGVIGSLTGSFEYDPTTNVYSNMLITHVPDTVEPSPLTFSTFVSGTATTLSLYNGPPNPDDYVGRHSLSLIFLSALSDLGGPVAVSGSATYFTGLRSEDITGGNVLADPVATPLPPAVLLFASGLSAVGLLGWRRKRKNASAIAA